MKIWFPVIRGGSGADVFTLRLADALRRRNVDAVVSFFDSRYEFAPWLLSCARAPEATTLVHANAWHGYAFHRPGLPLVVTEHLDVFAHDFRRYKSFAQHIYHLMIAAPGERASFRRATAITCVSHDTARTLAERAPRDKLCVVPTWVDTRVFVPVSGRTRSPDEPFRLLFVGNPTRRKGADLLRAIMEKLGPRFVLQFTSGLRDLRCLRITPNMEALGHISDPAHMRAIYQGADALLFPSRHEGLSLVLLEAMASGLPVVAANCSSMPEVVADKRTGLLCPPDDVDAFVESCRLLASDPATAQGMGAAGRKRAVKEFDESIVVPRYIDVYRAACAHG